MGYKQGYLAWFTLSNRTFGMFEVNFDPAFYAAMTDHLEHFWIENIQGKKEPKEVSLEDVMKKFPRSFQGKTVEVTDEVMEAINEIKIKKPLIKELEDSVKKAEETVKTYMADAEILCLPGTLESNPQIVATWKTGKDKEKFDAKTFKTEHEDIYNQYVSTTPGNRTFLIK